jgi:micrococcal nuclease
MFGFLLLSGWVVTAAVIALAWVGWRSGRRLVTGIVVGAVAGLLWPITLWVGVGALISQHRRRRTAAAVDPARLAAQRHAAASFARQAELARSPESAQYWHAEVRRLGAQQRAVRTASSRRTVTGVTVLGCMIASFATFGVLGAVAPAPAVVPVAGAAQSAPEVAPAAPAADRAVVTAVIDGDTFDADVDGRAVRVRMLNIDAPELSDPAADMRCLGPEAAALLSSLIPVGSNVVLEYDAQRTDLYDRTLAGVLTENGVLVNAEVARAGLADTVVVDGNVRFLPQVEAAQREAAQHGRGLYGTESACTLPGRAHAVTTALAAVPAAATLPAAATADELDRVATDAAGVVALAAATRDAFTAERYGVVWAVYTTQEHERFVAEAIASWESTVRAESALRAAATAARTREADAARAAEEQAAAARAEAVRAEAARADAARAEAVRAERAREAERQRAAAAPERPASEESPSSSAGSGSGPVVHPGSFCDNAGATGVTKKGTAMRCRMDSKGERLRWASA